MDYAQNEKRPFVFGCIDFFSGSVASIANVLVGLPLDTVKVKMQMYPWYYKGTWDCFRKTVKTNGVRNLYSGLLPALVADLSEKSVLFCAYGYTQFVMNKYVLCKNEQQIRCNQQTTFESALCGFFAAFFSSLTLCPTELVKCKIQALQDSSKLGQLNTFRVISQVFKEDGLIGFYKGLRLTMIREMPGYFFYFGGYTLTCNLLSVNKESIDLINLSKIAFAGGVGGFSLWIVVYPFDLAKTNVQVLKKDEDICKFLIKTFKEKKIRGLYSGLMPTLIRTFPATGTLFVVYELVNNSLSNKYKKIYQYSE